MSESTVTPSAKSSEDHPVSVPWLLVALVVWFVSAFFHKEGLVLAGDLFAWAQKPGTLTEQGGTAGMRVLELSMGSFFGGIALAVMCYVGWRMRKVGRRRLAEAAVPWVVWAVLTYVIWKVCIVYATEMVHFGQYALVGFLMAWALGRGRHAQLAFLITFALGFIDELYQHYWLSALEVGKWMDHWMDWSDPVLDGLGACGGILPFVTLARLRAREAGEALPSSLHYLKRFLVVAGVILLPLLLLDPVETSEKLGHYRLFPYWGEYSNNKPTHWPAPREGIPLMLGCVFLLGLILEPRRRPLSQAGLAGLLILVAVGIDPPSRKKGMPVHNRVPYAQAVWTDGPIKIDGVLDEPAWKKAPRLGPFRNSKTGEKAKQETYAYVLWDKDNVYFAFEVYDDDIWARDVPRDTTSLPGDEVVEVFLDDGGDELTYYEIEVSPRNVVYDLFCLIPQAPMDYNPFAPFMAVRHWDAKGLRTAVKVEGTVDTIEGFWQGGHARADTDSRYFVEMALPWSDIKPIPNIDDHRPVPPKPGQRWRMGLYRVDRPRFTPADLEGGPMTAAEARALIPCSDKEWDELTKVIPRDKAGLYSRLNVHQQAAARKAEYQAWSPVWAASFHRPKWFGVLEFVGPDKRR